MRVLVLSNMRPSASHPERGQFVRDQVDALRRLDGLQVELYEFPPGARALVGTGRDLHSRYRGQRLDVVHAHFGLTAWPALAVRARVRGLTMHGTDLAHARTRLLTRAVLPSIDLPVAVSEELVSYVPGYRARARTRAVACGVNMDRFRVLDRAHARSALGLDGDAGYLLFPADPARPEKRHDRALALARTLDARLLTLGGVPPERVPLYVNAAHAVVVPSEREGFGLAAIEALACDVPVLATPVGVHPHALEGIAGTVCEPFDLERWGAAAGAVLAQPDPRVAGRVRAERYSSARCAQELADAWRSLVPAPG